LLKLLVFSSDSSAYFKVRELLGWTFAFLHSQGGKQLVWILLLVLRGEGSIDLGSEVVPLSAYYLLVEWRQNSDVCLQFGCV
jgi:hypothetical protein